MPPKPPPFVDITKENVTSLQHVIKQTLNCASFIALDTEFTGLGGKEVNTRASNIEERYVNLCKVVKTHALVAFGLTVFEEAKSNIQGGSESLEKQYNVYNFNFNLLSQVDHIISPQSLQFLSDSGFDFNKQIRKGIPYTPGCDKSNSNSNDPNSIMRSLFSYIITRNVPIVVHNGFLDLIYLYYSFYADLPDKLNSFVADLSEMFSGGIVDTKYIADFVTREKSSFLAYLFRKYEREQVDNKFSDSKEYLFLRILNCVKNNHNDQFLQSNHFEISKINSLEKLTREKSYCEQYALHGFCKLRMRCGNSHDLDFILDEQAKEAGKKRKKRKLNQSQPQTTREICQSTEHVSASEPPTLLPSTKPDQFDTYHSAHFDAYMTGFIFARQILKYNKSKVMNEYVNKLYLIGKNLPLLVEKSQFSKTSDGHKQKMVTL
ncbi:17287_t:CDS:2 [Funneliformis geosporum]|uniref:6473_t:CDS:1 n=1 Tax=Funneliformis geosporum TaxID=1117311 RepID=A0A9W4WSX4_9GLOM|nr:6473_t:CDS:2 [Funneliformis geosporum]CAI2184655.1 17287_t:CDS:2 [Funneliformis geosporum]